MTRNLSSDEASGARRKKHLLGVHNLDTAASGAPAELESAPSSPEEAARSLEINFFIAKNFNKSSLLDTVYQYPLPAGLIIRDSRQEQQLASELVQESE